MAAEPTLALVVKGNDWSETSRIVTLFGREVGKVRALAKGGRRLKSNFETALDLLNVCQIMFIRKASGGLDLLTEARVEERFPHLRSNLPALYAGYYVAELLADGTQDYDPHPALFDAALATLRSLAEPAGSDPANGPGRVFRAVSTFELVWLQELGYRPRLEACVGCDRTLGPTSDDRPIGFSPTLGGVVCEACRPTARDWRPLSIGGWQSLRGLTAGTGESGSSRREVRALLGHAVSVVLGRRPRLLNYVESGTRDGG